MVQKEFSRHSGYFIQEIARKTTYLLNEAFLPLGITYSQFRVLNCLWKRGSLTQREIHEIIAVKPSTLTGLIHLLARKKLVERTEDEADGRANRIRLSEEGRILQKPSWEIIEAFESRMTKGIDEPEKDRLIRHLRRIDKNLE